MKKISFVISIILILIISFSAIGVHAENDSVAPMRYGRTGVISTYTNKDAMLAAYDKLVEGCANREDTISLEGTGKIKPDEFKDLYIAFHNDYPEYFWLASGYSLMTDQNTNSVVSVSPQYYFSKAELGAAKSTFEAKAKELTKQLDGKSDYEKSLIIHDRLAGAVSYVSGKNDQNAYGALVEGKAVCAGYAKAYQHLLNRVGIAAWSVLGKSINPVTHSLENHEWNLVLLDGFYYYTDVTWDDQGKNLFHAYFNMSEERMAEKHTVDFFKDKLPRTKSDEANYFVKNNLVYKNYDPDTIAAALKKNKTIHIYAVNDPDNFQKQLKGGMEIIVEKTGAPAGSGYSYNMQRLDREIVLSLSISEPNHTHSLTHHPKTSTSVEYYSCSCGMWFSDSAGKKPIADKNSVVIGNGGTTNQKPGQTQDIKPNQNQNQNQSQTATPDPDHTHTPAEEFKHNDTEHWKVCSECGEVMTETKSAHTSLLECEICSYKVEISESDSKTLILIGAAVGGILLVLVIVLIVVLAKKPKKTAPKPENTEPENKENE